MTSPTVQVAVVTGAGSGIGRATATAMAKQGTTVLACGRRLGPLESLAQSQTGVIPVVADITTSEGVDAIVAAVQEHGSLSSLVHNAGTFRFTPLAAGDLETGRDLFEVAVFAPMALTQALLPLFGDQGGSITFVSSNAGESAVPAADSYAASKAAQNSLTRTWALELAERRIRVNAVAPAAVRTNVYASNGLSESEVENYFAYQAGRTPLGRAGEVHDITPWIEMFVDPRSSWVTGQIITLDGGVGLTAA